MSVKYIVTTVNKKYSQALHHLLNSMIYHGINQDDIFISAQNMRARNLKFNKQSFKNASQGLVCVNIPQKIYEYSFFITAKGLLDSRLVSASDWFFLIHDTSIIGLDHIKYIENAMEKYSQDYDIIYGDNTGRHNIGLYNYKSINIGYNIWKKYKTISKQLAIDIEHNNANSIYSIKKCNRLNIFYPNNSWIDIDKVKVYNSKIKRNVSRISFFDIDKYYIFIAPQDQHPNIV